MQLGLSSATSGLHRISMYLRAVSCREGMKSSTELELSRTLHNSPSGLRLLQYEGSSISHRIITEAIPTLPTTSWRVTEYRGLAQAQQSSRAQMPYVQSTFRNGRPSGNVLPSYPCAG